MLKNPYINAIIAAAYIVLIVLLINGAAFLKIPDNTLLIPIIMLSLLVLSVSIMGVLFFYEPARLFLDNQKREALVFVGKSAAVFACFILILVVVLIYVSRGVHSKINIGVPAPVATPGTPIVGVGERCGGNMVTAPQCDATSHCAPVPGSHLPFGDVGGICVKN